MELRKLISKFLTSLVEKNYAQANSDLKDVVEEKIRQRVKAASDKLNRKKQLASKKSECSGKAKCHCVDCKDSLQEEGVKLKNPKTKGKEWHNLKGEESNENESNEDSSKLSKKEKFLKMIASKSKKNKKGKNSSSNKKNSEKGNK